jgi:putative phosphoesterase
MNSRLTSSATGGSYPERCRTPRHTRLPADLELGRAPGIVTAHPVPTQHIFGVISDTHGLVRPEVLEALAGVERILHAGDVGAPEVLAALAKVAPVVAVRGNNDVGPWARRLGQTETIAMAGVRILMLHDVKELAVDPAAAGVSAVIAGHSHRPGDEERGGALFFNPCSAGPRRFKLPVAVGKLYVTPGAVHGEIVRLG